MKLWVLLLTLVLAAPACAAGPVCDAVWHDDARGRDVPVRIRLPDGSGKVPVVLWSHGLGGDVNGGTRWASAWAEGGIATIHIQHPGSDSALWAGTTSIPEAREKMRAGMTTAQFYARIADVGFVLSAISAHPQEGACNLTRLDLTRAGVGGHSFGAVTTQALAGQRFRGFAVFADGRFRAAMAFSPSAPNQGTSEEAFRSITIPFMSVTGSADAVPELTPETPTARTEPYLAMPPGGKYLLYFDGADHLVFGGHEMKRTPRPSDAHIRAVVPEATTKFWQATLMGDASAAAWLTAADGLKAKLLPGDRIEAK